MRELQEFKSFGGLRKCQKELSSIVSTENIYSPSWKFLSPPTIGVWGERRREYLRKHQHAIYTGMLLNSNLNAHLEEIDKQANSMFSQLVKQFSDAEGITEGLKTENQLLWVQCMNNIRNRAAEIVCTELIYA